MKISFPFISSLPIESKCPIPDLLITQTFGIVYNEERQVEIWSASPGIMLKVSGSSDFYIAPSGEVVMCVRDEEQGFHQPCLELSDLDREVFLGPALVLALAMRSTWCLHSSVAMFKEQTIAFVGESGRGKSTLAAYLGSSGWQRVADDILPVTLEKIGVQAWPHFPQLKLPADNQPGLNFPEQLPLDKVCLLEKADASVAPKLEQLPPSKAVRVLLAHTAGSRLFSPDLLAGHLEFCARASERIPVYRLIYPHRKDVLPEVKELLESIC